MRVLFQDEYLQYIYEEGQERGKPRYSFNVIKSFIKKINILIDVADTKQLRGFKSLRLEALSGNYKGYSSIRVNQQFRIIIKVIETPEDATVEVIEVYDLTDYH